MKSKMKIMGLLAMILVIGVYLTGCSSISVVSRTTTADGTVTTGESNREPRSYGMVYVKINDPLGQTYSFACVKAGIEPSSLVRTEKNGSRVPFRVDPNGEYTVYYAVYRSDETGRGIPSDRSTWRSKSVSVSNGESVEVSIP